VDWAFFAVFWAATQAEEATFVLESRLTDPSTVHLFPPDLFARLLLALFGFFATGLSHQIN
jgi:hypothetical protein